jgi:hypothetical protein
VPDALVTYPTPSPVPNFSPFSSSIPTVEKLASRPEYSFSPFSAPLPSLQIPTVPADSSLDETWVCPYSHGP